jgi:hypothetical protein
MFESSLPFVSYSIMRLVDHKSFTALIVVIKLGQRSVRKRWVVKVAVMQIHRPWVKPGYVTLLGVAIDLYRGVSSRRRRRHVPERGRLVERELYSVERGWRVVVGLRV